MMRWPPWPAAAVSTKKYTVVVVVRRLHGLELEEEVVEERRALVVEVKWKGQKKSLRLGSAPPVKRNFTKEGGIGDDGAVEWDEEFTSVCRFSGYKEEGEPLFFPWELAFTVLFNVSHLSSSQLFFAFVLRIDDIFFSFQFLCFSIYFRLMG